MRILVLPRYARIGASSRLRFYQYIPFLEEHGIEVIVKPLLSDLYLLRLYQQHGIPWMNLLASYLQRAWLLIMLKDVDIVWIEKELFPSFPAWLERWLKWRGVPYVVDYDDAIFHNYDLSSNRVLRRLAYKIDQVMRLATTVVCGNRYLAERAQNACAEHIEIIPTVIDLERYKLEEYGNGEETITIGWVGSPSTVKYLELISPVLTELAEQFRIKLHVIGAKFGCEGVEVLCLPWEESREVEYIQAFDIGVMPLLDTPWERGKCGYKLIQYMACAVPVIASPVGVNREIVKDGVNGYVVSSDMEWKHAFEQLCKNPELRRSMGKKGRSDVEEKYCLQVTAPKVLELLRVAALSGSSGVG